MIVRPVRAFSVRGTGGYFSALPGVDGGKAPGCDGLPMEFYLKIWNDLGNDLVLVLNSAFCLGSLSLSAPGYYYFGL